MKICFVAHSAGNGGAERSLLETIDALSGQGVECCVLTPASGPFTDSLDAMHIAYRVLPFKRWAAREGGSLWRRLARTLSTLALAPAAAIWIRRRRADLVFSNTISIGIGGLAAWLARRPHVWHIRELGYEHNRVLFDLGQRISLALMRSGSRLCLANSQCVAQHYREALAPTAIHVVDQCVQLDSRTPCTPPSDFDGLRLAVIGSLSPQKRQNEAIDAVGHLREKGRDVRLLIVGEGDPVYEASLRDQVESLRLGASVEFMGALDSAVGVIDWADIVVNCSRHEAFGRVTVESMLAGTPVVGARSGGTAELIRDGETGLLYEAGRTEDLVTQLMALANDPDRASRIGRNGRDWARKRFTRGRYGGELLRLLQPLTRPPAAAASTALRSNATSRADRTDTE